MLVDGTRTCMRHVLGPGAYQSAWIVVRAIWRLRSKAPFFPPDRAALTEPDLGSLDHYVRTVYEATRPPRGRDGTAGLNKLDDQCISVCRFKSRVGDAP